MRRVLLICLLFVFFCFPFFFQVNQLGHRKLQCAKQLCTEQEGDTVEGERERDRCCDTFCRTLAFSRYPTFKTTPFGKNKNMLNTQARGFAEFRMSRGVTINLMAHISLWAVSVLIG